MAIINGGVSFWWQELGLPTPRAALGGNATADVCVVGGGYTGLWTAYYLKKANPDLNVVVLEQAFAGFGASGRNGGWLANTITGGRASYVKSHSRQAAIDQQRAMNAAVDEVISVARAEGIDADIRKGGELYVAYTSAQLERLRKEFTSEQDWPHTDVKLLTREQTDAHVRVNGALGGLWQPHCAVMNPAKLVRGLADVVERAGVTIYENTPVTEIRPGVAVTPNGDVKASYVIRATEGFTPNLKGQHRTLLPMNSSMIVTAPLSEGQWAEIGWSDGSALSDFAHVYMYAQRTIDGRIAFGGRGVPYRYGSRVDDAGQTQGSAIDGLTQLLRRFFPAASGTEITHAWSGVLGVPRDWQATVGLDNKTGIGWAGGYVGTGVTTTNLAGRTLADLVLGNDTELTRLPWVGHRAKKWEVEPLRWLAVQGIYAAYSAADRQELRGRQSTAPVARIADLIAGR